MKSINIEKLLSSNSLLAIAAAKKAGEAVSKVYKSNFSFKEKSDGPITKADLESNKIIIGFLQKTHLPILSEENCDNKKKVGGERIWIIDPLDGTADFIKGTDNFCILISLVEKQVPVLGLIYNPVKNFFYIAEKGKGSYCEESNGWKKMQVSNIDNLASARGLMSAGHLAEEEKCFLNKLKINYKEKGSALKVVEISCGRADLYFTFTNKIKLWDTAASHCIIHEAGGRMIDMSGGELLYDAVAVNHLKGILVTNGKLYKKLTAEYNFF